MSSLYPDESYCTSDVGRILYQLKTDWKCRTDVTKCEDEKHITGTFTVYTVEITCSPAAVIEDASERSFVIQTRYKEMAKLHAALAKLHKQLYLRGTFPVFPQPKLLGSSDPLVIQERRLGIENVLNFVFDSEVLRKARVLHEFVEKAKERAHTAHEMRATHVLYDNSTSILDRPNVFEDDDDEEEHHLEPTPIQQTTDSSNVFQFGNVEIEEVENRERSQQRRGENKSTSVMKRLFPKIGANSTTNIRNEDATTENVDYLVRAGQLVATAQRAEEEHAYELAFQCYKNAASSLIQGVQIESDITKRNAVRRKTAKYLVKAEKLYRTYLSLDGSVFNFEGLMTAAMQDPNILAFQCSNQSMKNYRFVGVLPNLDADRRVLLVEHKMSENNARFVMKLLEKGIMSTDDGTLKIFLPTNIPHMIQLIQFFETELHIILLLEYVETGRLWWFLNPFFEETESKYISELAENRIEVREGENFVKKEEVVLKKEENVKQAKYRGKRLLFTVGVDYERVVEMRDETSTDIPEGNALVCTMGIDVTGRSNMPSGDFSIGDTVGCLAGREESPAAIKLNFEKSGTVAAAAGSSKVLKEEEEEAVGIEAFSKNLAKSMRIVRENLQRRRKWEEPEIPECLVTHWAAQIVSYFFVLHTEHEEFRGDFNPEDILIDIDGNLLMTYIGKWYTKKFPRLLDGYSAPEAQIYGWTPSAESDIWTIGALIFEMLAGRSLANAAPHGLHRNMELPVPESSMMSFVAKDLLNMILVPIPGCRPTLDEIRAHPFFRHIDWRRYDNPSSSGGAGESEGSSKMAPTTSQNSIDL